MTNRERRRERDRERHKDRETERRRHNKAERQRDGGRFIEREMHEEEKINGNQDKPR